MSFSNNEEVRSSKHVVHNLVPEFSISPVSTLSANLKSTLHIRRNLVFSSNENTPVKTETDEDTMKNSSSPTSRFKNAKRSPCRETCEISELRSVFCRKFSQYSSKANTDKENKKSYRRSVSLDFAFMDEISPSKQFASKKPFSRERLPLEDYDSNSQDSGYSNGSSIFSEDSKLLADFRFVEPNRMAPRRTYFTEFSQNAENMSPMLKRQTMSPRMRRRFSSQLSTDSLVSDFSDDGFGENILLPSDGRLLERDENAQLPAGFSSLMSGTICNLSKINELPIPTNKDEPFSPTKSQRSFFEATPTRIMVKSTTVESEFCELMVQDRDAVKRPAIDKECGFTIKRRKSCPKLKLSFEKSNNSLTRSWSVSGPATATKSSTRGTLFNYGFKKNVKLQRAFSETEACIKNAVQRAMSNPELIGDYSKSFILPSKMAQCGNTRMAYLTCDTLAKLIMGEYDDLVRSFTVIDCRFPYEFDGGHIYGAVNIYTEDQMENELKENGLIRKPEGSNGFGKRDILIFHCEFSSKRGPNMVRYVRNEDRNKNLHQYPKLDYPEIYLLQGGYAKFFKQYKDLCDPCGYRPMVDPNH